MKYKPEHSVIKKVIINSAASKRLLDINFRRSVLNRIIELIKLIGSQGLNVRGKINETLKTFYDNGLNDGSFMEI